MSYADMVFAIVPDAPPTRKNLRATSCPAPISAKVPYLAESRLMRRAFSSVPISIWGFIHFSTDDSQPPQIAAFSAGHLCQTRYVSGGESRFQRYGLVILHNP